MRMISLGARGVRFVVLALALLAVLTGPTRAVAQSTEMVFNVIRGSSADATTEDFAVMCDEIEKEIIKEEMQGVEIGNEELEVSMGDVQ